MFRSNKDCSRHVNAVHLGERNHECDTCGRRFNRPENLRRHKSKVHRSGVNAQDDDRVQEEASNLSQDD